MESYTKGKKQIEPKKSNRMRSYDMPKEQLKQRREERFKNQARMKKSGPLTDTDFLKIMQYSGKVK